MEISARHQKKHHYDVICYHSVSKVVYFVEHDIGYQQGGTPPQYYNEIKSPVLIELR